MTWSDLSAGQRILLGKELLWQNKSGSTLANTFGTTGSYRNKFILGISLFSIHNIKKETYSSFRFRKGIKLNYNILNWLST